MCYVEYVTDQLLLTAVRYQNREVLQQLKANEVVTQDKGLEIDMKI